MIFLKECKDNLLLLKRNLWPIIQFEVVYKLLCACVFTPLFLALFHWSITYLALLFLVVAIDPLLLG